MSGEQQVKNNEATQALVTDESPVGGNLGAFANISQQNLDAAARLLDGLAGDDEQTWLLQARQRGGQ